MSLGKALVLLLFFAGYGLGFTFLVQLYATTGEVAAVEQVAAAGEVAAVEQAEALPQVVLGDPEKGKLLYGTCVACHGKVGEGGRMFNSPRLANQAPWYLKSQLVKFKEGVRGAHPLDVFGMQMAPMAKLLPNEAAIDDVVAYIAPLEPAKPADRGRGDAVKGRVTFAVCSACHGPQAQGNVAQKAPKLTGQHAWYLVKQIKNFKGGLRGAHADDAEGKLMGPIAQTLADDSAIEDVVAYIQSLSEE